MENQIKGSPFLFMVGIFYFGNTLLLIIGQFYWGQYERRKSRTNY